MSGWGKRGVRQGKGATEGLENTYMYLYNLGITLNCMLLVLCVYTIIIPNTKWWLWELNMTTHTTQPIKLINFNVASPVQFFATRNIIMNIFYDLITITDQGE